MCHLDLGGGRVVYAPLFALSLDGLGLQFVLSNKIIKIRIRIESCKVLSDTLQAEKAGPQYTTGEYPLLISFGHRLYFLLSECR